MVKEVQIAGTWREDRKVLNRRVTLRDAEEYLKRLLLEFGRKNQKMEVSCHD